MAKKDYWFKRKQYGWGWVPATWQGWLVMLGYLVAMSLVAFTINEDSTEREIVLMFVLPIFVLSVALILVCYKTGETPRWQWGAARKDKRFK